MGADRRETCAGFLALVAARSTRTASRKHLGDGPRSHRWRCSRRMGLSLSRVSPEVRAAYVEALRDPDHSHAICEEYRAAATIDREHDKADRASERRIVCPLLALWSAEGALDTWYVEEGGPIALWRGWADDVRGHALDAGHFFPEEAAEQTADALNRFFGAAE